MNRDYIQEIIDLPSAKERFLGNYSLFARFLYQFPDRSLYGDLEQALNAGNLDKAFEVAHTMKGIVGNLSLKLVQPPLFALVETLRIRKQPTEEERRLFAAAYQRTVAAIEQLRTENQPLF